MTITIVSGFGRCGSSMIMQMLEAGGMPTSGEFPAFENEYGAGLFSGALTADMMWKIDGCAVKLLDPHRGIIPKGPQYRTIWCVRDPGEQAKSQAKFLRLLTGIQMSRAEVRGFVRSYEKDKAPALQALYRAGVPPDGIMALRFQFVLARPWEAAEKINAHCGGGLNTEKMAAAVIQRSPACAPGLDLEMRLIEERKRAQK